MKFIISMVTTAFVLGFAGSALAGPCDAVKREMAFGEAALEDATDSAGFKRAAEEFSKATQKAPSCAAAFFNLGLVQEKAGELNAAKTSYEQYLKLAPRASDAGAVEKQIFKLDYRINQAQSKEGKIRQQSEQAHQIEGKWRDSLGMYQFEVVTNGNKFDIYMVASKDYNNGGWKEENRHDFKGSFGVNGEISGYYFVTAQYAEILKQQKRCNVLSGWKPIEAMLGQQSKRLKIKILHTNPSCGSTILEVILIR